MGLRRRDVLALVASALALPSMALAQVAQRRVGLLLGFLPDDPEATPRAAAFRAGLAAEGWSEGRNADLAFRYAGTDAAMARTFAQELVALRPDVLVTHGSPATAEAVALTKTTPIVFTLVADPIGSGFVTSLGQPTGNVTGFLNFDSSLVGKWVELLREVQPGIRRVLMLFNPDTAPDRGAFFMKPLMDVSGGIGIETIAGPFRSDAEVESVIGNFAATPGGALVAPPDISVNARRTVIMKAAAAYKLPAVYPYRFYAAEGGLLSYGIDTTEIFRLVGGYAGRILSGTKLSDLPIRAPTKFEFVVNLKTAKAMDIAIPPSVLLRADEVVE
jgi:putative ABC transport system substrate-binding protein